MSKIINEKYNKNFNPIITDISYDKLLQFMNDNKSVEISNALLISIPQNNNEDINGEASIWMTDKDGYLLNISKPNKLYEDIQKSNNTLLININQSLNDTLDSYNKIQSEITTLHNRIGFNNEYQIILNGNGGKFDENSTLVFTKKYGETLKGINNYKPERYGYNFVGWTEPFLSNNVITKIDENTIVMWNLYFYAIWKKNESLPDRESPAQENFIEES